MYLDEDSMVYYVFRHGPFKIIYILDKAGTVCFCLCTDGLFKICYCLDDVDTVRYVMFKALALQVLYLYLSESARQRKIMKKVKFLRLIIIYTVNVVI